MKRRIQLLLTIVCVVMVLAPAMASAGAQGKKVLMILAPRKFQDTEYSKPRKALDAAGAVVTIASTKTGTLKGAKGKKVKSDVKLSDVDASAYDAVIVIGGNGIFKLWNNEAAHAVVKKAMADGKLVGAICAGPGVLAKAGVLEGRKATGYPASKVTSALKGGGCIYQNEDVVVDGNLITANGPGASQKFAEAIVTALSK